MVSTSSIPRFMGPPEFRGRGRTVGGNAGDDMDGRVSQLQEQLRAGAETGVEMPAPGEGNNGIGRAMTGQVFGELVSAIAQDWKAGEAPAPTPQEGSGSAINNIIDISPPASDTGSVAEATAQSFDMPAYVPPPDGGSGEFEIQGEIGNIIDINPLEMLDSEES